MSRLLLLDPGCRHVVPAWLAAFFEYFARLGGECMRGALRCLTRTNWRGAMLWPPSLRAREELMATIIMSAVIGPGSKIASK